MGVELLLLRQGFEVWLDYQWHHRWWRVRVELRDVHHFTHGTYQGVGKGAKEIQSSLVLW